MYFYARFFSLSCCLEASLLALSRSFASRCRGAPQIAPCVNARATFLAARPVSKLRFSVSRRSSNCAVRERPRNFPRCSRKKGSGHNARSLLSYLIPVSPDYLQISGFSGIALNFFPDMANMYRNGIVCSDCLHIPDTFINLTV